MNSKFRNAPRRRGILTFEWILVLALTVIGVVGGIAVIRDALIVEMSTYSNAIGALDFGYTVAEYDSMVSDEGGVAYTVPGSLNPGNTEQTTFGTPLVATPNSKATTFHP